MAVEHYHAPLHLADALEHLRGGEATILAGGTDLMPQSHAGRVKLARVLVNVRRIPELDGIGIEDGEIRIGIFSSLASGFLSDLFQAFGQRHKSVKLLFTDGNPAEHVAAVRQHQLDVAFLTGLTSWPDCQSQHLWSERIFAVLPLHHPHADDMEISFGDLAGETFIVSESAPGEEIHDYLVQRLAD